jgi:hypothetical protein
VACDDCGAARVNTHHRRFDLKCPWCGARYLQTLKTWPAPRDMGGRLETTKERQAWRAQVLKDWSDFGHDAEHIKKLAAAEKVPFEPLEERNAGSSDARKPAAGPQVRKQEDRRGRPHVR